ncbi:unnamed protein product [Prunus armeniaca]
MYTIWATRPLAIDCLISFLYEPHHSSPSHLKPLRASSPLAEPSPSWLLSFSVLPSYTAAVPFAQPLCCLSAMVDSSTSESQSASVS